MSNNIIFKVDEKGKRIWNSNVKGCFKSFNDKNNIWLQIELRGTNFNLKKGDIIHFSDGESTEGNYKIVKMDAADMYKVEKCNIDDIQSN